ASDETAAAFLPRWIRDDRLILAGARRRLDCGEQRRLNCHANASDFTLMAIATGRTQTGVALSWNVSPAHASKSVCAMTDAIASAASGGTALPMRSRHAESDEPYSSRISSASTRLCSAASSNVVNGR